MLFLINAPLSRISDLETVRRGQVPAPEVLDVLIKPEKHSQPPSRRDENSRSPCIGGDQSNIWLKDPTLGRLSDPPVDGVAPPFRDEARDSVSAGLGFFLVERHVGVRSADRSRTNRPRAFSAFDLARNCGRHIVTNVQVLAPDFDNPVQCSFSTGRDNASHAGSPPGSLMRERRQRRPDAEKPTHQNQIRLNTCVKS